MKHINSVAASSFLSIFLLMVLSFHSSLTFANMEVVKETKMFVEKSKKRLIHANDVVQSFTNKGEKDVNYFKKHLAKYQSFHEICEEAIKPYSSKQASFKESDYEKIRSCNKRKMNVLWYKLKVSYLEIFKATYPGKSLPYSCSTKIKENGGTSYNCQSS